MNNPRLDSRLWGVMAPMATSNNMAYFADTGAELARHGYK